MTQDILTVMWKEFRELKQLLGGTRGQWIAMAIFMGVFGIMMPLQAGPTFVKTPIMAGMFAFLPLFIVIQIVPDSFAGERERHTLETLLATRLSDRGILLGKILTIVLYGWCMAAAIACIMLISVNVVYHREGITLPPWWMLAGSAFVSFLVALFATCLGVFISLKAQTVKQAQQNAALIVMAIWFLPFMIGPLLLKSIPKETLKVYLDPIAKNLSVINPYLAGGLLIFAFLLVNLLLLAILMKRFKRARLILSN